MRTIRINLKDKTVISLGRIGENSASKVVFDCRDWVKEYGSGTITLCMRRSQDSIAYPIDLDVNAGIATWTVSLTDTKYQGAGECELSYTVGTVVVKSEIWSVNVKRSLASEETVPDPWDTWLSTVLTYRNEAQAAARTAAADAAKAEAVETHPPKLNSDNYWLRWDYESSQYVNTGVYAVGPQGPVGATGEQGLPGDAAGFGTPTVTVDANVGTPEAIVTASGPSTTKVFSFIFRNLKGATGPGVPSGGTTGQIIRKKSATDYNTEWTDEPYSTAEQEKVSANTEARHTHANKSILDTITQALIDKWNTVTGKYTKPSTGIPKTDLASTVQTSLGKADTALQEHQSLSAYRTSSAQDDIDDAQDDAIEAKYTKPSTGIPKSDLASDVQTSLGKANTALQTHQDISGKANKSGDTFTGAITIPHSSVFTQSAGTVVVPSANNIDSSVMAGDMTWHDIWSLCRLSTPSYYQTADGESWNEATLNKALFDQVGKTGVNIFSSTVCGSRWVWSQGIQYAYARVLAIGYNWTYPRPEVNIILEASTDGITWSEKLNITESGRGGEIAYYFCSGLDDESRVRLTIKKVDPSDQGTLEICALKYFTPRYGNQGEGKYLHYPYNWDKDANVYPIANTACTLGTSSRRWLNVYANAFTDANGNNLVTTKEDTSNKVTSISASSTDTQYPSAKAVYDFVMSMLGGE